MRYGFVTYARPCDAYTAIDDSSKNAAICHYDISFGGRRTFCRQQYFDLGELSTLYTILYGSLASTKHLFSSPFLSDTDNTIHATYREEISTPQSASTPHDNDVDDEFDVLLRKVKEKLQENKK